MAWTKQIESTAQATNDQLQISHYMADDGSGLHAVLSVKSDLGDESVDMDVSSVIPAELAAQGQAYLIALRDAGLPLLGYSES